MEKSEILQEIGQKVRAKRKELKISQNELALRTNKDQQSIHRLEAGKINPSYIYLLEIAEGLEISLADLLNITT